METTFEPMGEVFTRGWVVEWMLDLVGYVESEPLHERVLIEPSCGAGAFLLPAVERLLAACRRHGMPVAEAADAIWATDLHGPSVDSTRKIVQARLQAEGLGPDAALELAERWVRVDDFLLTDDLPGADFVIGNPPYVRLEDVPDALGAAYRKRWRTMGGRADLYIGFYERGLQALRPGARLGYICADRWMRNTYGRGLRKLITEGGFAVESVVRMHDVDCFEEQVSAYPAITVLRRGEQGDGVVVEASRAFGPESVPAANEALTSFQSGDSFSVGVVDGWFDADVWPEGTPEQLAELADHEKRHSPLEDELRRTRVGIGVATGADRLFVTSDGNLVEEERLLPLVMAKHISDGRLRWSPTYLVSPWDEGGLVDLEQFPRLRGYYEQHFEQLRRRHTAEKTPARWYKTIDRVNVALTGQPKILLADMKSRMTPVIEPGGLYPHHNLYWITSDVWDLEVLAGLLLSDQAELFIRAYCVKMRGGTLRMQAQYLRRIRLPEPTAPTDCERDALRDAYIAGDRTLATDVARSLYAR